MSELILKSIAMLRNLRFPGKHRVLDPIVPRAGIRSATVFGARMQLDLADLIQRAVWMGTYERQETRWAQDWLKPGDTFVDAGANIGYFTMLAADRCGPKGRVFAFEPNSSCRETLVRAVEENDLSQVTVSAKGLGRRDEEVKIYVPPLSAGNNNATMTAVDGWPSNNVSITSLDAWSESSGVDSIKLLKIDVEGQELAVLEGASGLIEAGRIRAVMVEFNSYWLESVGSSVRELFEKIQKQQFRPMRPNGVQPPDSGLATCFFVHEGTIRD